MTPAPRVTAERIADLKQDVQGRRGWGRVEGVVDLRELSILLDTADREATQAAEIARLTVEIEALRDDQRILMHLDWARRMFKESVVPEAVDKEKLKALIDEWAARRRARDRET